MALFTFFLSAILVSTFACGVLSLFGSIVIARERITNVLFYSQTAKIGMILGLFFNTVLNTKSTLTPFFFSLLLTAIFYIASEYIGAKAIANKEAIFLALFTIASQVEELFLFLFKGIEKHELGQFYGDIVTIEGEHIFLLSVFTFLFLVIFIFYEKKWFIESFNQMILKMKNRNFDNFVLYHISVMIFITICVLFMGLWLTLVSLLVPSIFLSKLPFKNRWVYYAILFFVSAGGCSLGFVGSLLIEGSPTTPMIICTIGLITFLVRFVFKLSSYTKLTSKSKISR
jgi:ABC-type Mn2+/Zn2+ transport system permease subunit